MVVEASAMDDTFIADPRRRVPRCRRHLQHAVICTHGIEESPVVELFEEIIEIFGEENRTAAFGTLAKPEPGRFLHLRDQIALLQCPRRRCSHFAGSDLRIRLLLTHNEPPSAGPLLRFCPAICSI